MWSWLILRQYPNIHLCWGSAPVRILYSCVKYTTAWQNLLCGNTVLYFVLGQRYKLFYILVLNKIRMCPYLLCHINRTPAAIQNLTQQNFYFELFLMWHEQSLCTLLFLHEWHFWQIYYLTSVVLERNNPWSKHWHT